MQLLLLLLTIPGITGLIGWVTNWAAVKMIFHPEQFIGIGPIGWQGILTRQAHKFALNVADMVTGNFLTNEEMVQRVDPAAGHLAHFGAIGCCVEFDQSGDLLQRKAGSLGRPDETQPLYVGCAVLAGSAG